MSFNALIVEKDEEGKTHAGVREIGEDRLPEAEVTVAVDYSTLNYKDGLCIGPGGGLVRNYPHIPGIDFAGTVESSSDSRYKPGDKVVLTGWRVGEAHWGGYAQKARVKADWLVPLPQGLTTRQAMAIGTAGFTAMLAVMALEDHGLTPGTGPVLVTGAAGGVGSVATAILARLGYEVAGVTGRPASAAYLESLGASRIVAREDLSEVTRKPLEGETWSGCVDAVGGDARPGAQTDEIRHFGRRRGPCRRRGARGRADHPVHPARRQSSGHRFGDAPLCRPAARLGAHRPRPADGQARGDDPARHIGRSAPAWRRYPQRPGSGPRRGRCQRLIRASGAGPARNPAAGVPIRWPQAPP